MRNPLLFAIIWFLFPISMHAQSGEEAIVRLLSDQVGAWNLGDINGYMSGYWDSDSTLFMSGGNLTKGYRNVLSRYERSYGTREKMGILVFSDLNIRMLSPTSGIAFGIWKLKRLQDEPWGRFTLIVEKKPEGWRITHDHTSSATD